MHKSRIWSVSALKISIVKHYYMYSWAILSPWHQETWPKYSVWMINVTFSQSNVVCNDKVTLCMNTMNLASLIDIFIFIYHRPENDSYMYMLNCKIYQKHFFLIDWTHEHDECVHLGIQIAEAGSCVTLDSSLTWELQYTYICRCDPE